MTTLEIKRFDSIRIENNNKNNNDCDIVREIPIIIMSSNENEKRSNSNIVINNNNDQISMASNNDLTTTSNNNNLVYNKYGFLQPNYQPQSLNNTLNKKDKNNKNKYSNENLNQSIGSSVSTSNKSAINNNNNNNHHNQHDNISIQNSNASVNGGSQNYTNTKELIQNTPIEYFVEDLPIEVIRSRELKWVDMLNNYDEWMSKRFSKLKQRCRKGIPQSMRYRAWLHLTNAIVYKADMNKKHNGNYYLKCLNSNSVDNKCLDEIKRDLHRQFPLHEMFHNNNDRGANMLFNVLRAYAAHNPKVGYCQSQGPIAALLVMHMPEEDAFWILIRISDFYLRNYYNPDLECIQIDGQTLFLLFKSINANAYKLMKRNSISPTLYMTEWFMCIFARTLPWCTVLRVFDMFFSEGVKVLFRVGLYLLKCIFSNKNKLEQCLKMSSHEQQYAILTMLKDIDINYLKEDILVRESCKFEINENDIKVKYEKAKEDFKKYQKQQAEQRLQYQQQQQNNKKK